LDQRRNFPNTSLTTKFVGHNSQSVELITQNSAGTDRIVFGADSAGNTKIGPRFTTTSHVIESGVTRISTAANRFQFEKIDADADEKVWEFTNNSANSSFRLRTAGDDYSAGQAAWLVGRNGKDIDGHTFSTNTGGFTFSGGPVILSNAGLNIEKVNLTTPVVSDGNVYSGSYTPVYTAMSNVDSITAYPVIYTRVGNVIHISGVVLVNATNTTTATQVRFSLPTGSAPVITGAGTLNGRILTPNGSAGWVSKSTTHPTSLLLDFVSLGSTDITYAFTAMYSI
jgi:hypothetical protein